MAEGHGYSGVARFKRQRVDVGEPAFWMGRQFGVPYEFSFVARQVLKFVVPLDSILNSSEISVDGGSLRYRVFGSIDEGPETVAFINPITIHKLNTMSFTPAYTGQITAFDDGGIDETGLNPFPTARIRTQGGTGNRATQAATATSARGFGESFAYIVMTDLTGGGTDTIEGAVDLRFEERDWGF